MLLQPEVRVLFYLSSDASLGFGSAAIASSGSGLGLAANGGFGSATLGTGPRPARGCYNTPYLSACGAPSLLGVLTLCRAVRRMINGCELSHLTVIPQMTLVAGVTRYED